MSITTSISLKPQDLPVGTALDVSVNGEPVRVGRVRGDVWQVDVPAAERAAARMLRIGKGSAWIVKHPVKPLRQFTDIETAIHYAAS